MKAASQFFDMECLMRHLYIYSTWLLTLSNIIQHSAKHQTQEPQLFRVILHKINSVHRQNFILHLLLTPLDLTREAEIVRYVLYGPKITSMRPVYIKRCPPGFTQTNLVRKTGFLLCFKRIPDLESSEALRSKLLESELTSMWSFLRLETYH